MLVEQNANQALRIAKRGMSLRPESLSLRMRQNVCWIIRR